MTDLELLTHLADALEALVDDSGPISCSAVHAVLINAGHAGHDVAAATCYSIERGGLMLGPDWTLSALTRSDQK